LAGESDETLPVTELDYRSPTGELLLSVVEQGTASPTTARISIRHAGGKFHAPPGSLYRLLNNDLHFYARGQVRLALPEGHYQVKAARGPEYRLATAEFDVQAGRPTAVSVELVRWTDQQAAGWV